MQLALGDCLAIALLEAKGFTAHDFKVFHPGGSLGANLKYVSDVMHKGDRLPLAREGEPMSAALVDHDAEVFGCLGIVDGKGKLQSASSPTATCAVTWGRPAGRARSTTS